MAQPRLHEPRFTFGDYVKWADGQRWELLEGEARLMSPAPNRLHQEVLFELGRQVGNFLEGHRCRGYLAPFDVRLPLGDEPDEAVETVLQPDLAVVCDPAKLDDAGCRGAPDWIVEVLSPSDPKHDQIVKRDLYQRHGVCEYWILDSEERILTRYRFDEGSEARIEEAQGKTAVGVLPGLEVDWARVFPPPPDRREPASVA